MPESSDVSNPVLALTHDHPGTPAVVVYNALTSAGDPSTLTVNQYLIAVGGTGLGGPMVPIAMITGPSGARDGTVIPGTPPPGFDTTTQYLWSGIPWVVPGSGGGGGPGGGTDVTLDSGTVDGTLQPPTTSTFFATGPGLTGDGGAYTGMSVRFQAAGNPARRLIVEHTSQVSSGVTYHYFILAAAVPGAVLPDPPAAGAAFVIE